MLCSGKSPLIFSPYLAYLTKVAYPPGRWLPSNASQIFFRSSAIAALVRFLHQQLLPACQQASLSVFFCLRLSPVTQTFFTCWSVITYLIVISLIVTVQSNTSAFLTLSVHDIFSILLKNHICAASIFFSIALFMV